MDFRIVEWIVEQILEWIWLVNEWLLLIILEWFLWCFAKLGFCDASAINKILAKIELSIGGRGPIPPP
jgi:hypothetical protein